MMDFVRFSVWAFIDLCASERKHKHAWHEDWLDFVLRWIDVRFFIRGDFVDPDQGMMPTKKGGVWLQKRYGPHSFKGIGNMLDDPYFAEFRV
jgi:hypothetical protein